MDEQLNTYRVWEIGLEGSTYETIKATTHLKAREIYAQKWAMSVSDLDSREIVPAN